MPESSPLDSERAERPAEERAERHDTVERAVETEAAGAGAAEASTSGASTAGASTSGAGTSGASTAGAGRPGASTAGAGRPGQGRDEAAVRRFVEHMAMTFDDMGFPRMPARVLVAMMAADEASLTAGDLAERLEVSPAAISGAVRYLGHVGLIVREPAPGSRTHRYRLPDDLWYESSVTRRGLVKSVSDLAEEGVRALGGRDTPSGRRVGEMGDFYRFVDAELDGLLARWQATKKRLAQSD